MADDRSDEKPAFEVSADVVIRIEPRLSLSLGQLILDSDTTNKALIALGHQLRRSGTIYDES